MMEEYVPEWVLLRLKRVGQMIDFYANTCDVPFIVGAAQLPQATAKALVTLLSFGLDDVARGLLKPKGLHRHKPMGRVGRALTQALPEVGESIGREISKHSSAAQAAQAAGEGAVAKNLWRLDGTIQRALFYFMLTDVLVDFNRNIVKGIKEFGYCKVHRNRRALKNNGSFRYWNSIAGWDVLPTNPYVHGFDSIGVADYVHWEFETKTAFMRSYIAVRCTVEEGMPPITFRLGAAIWNYPKDRVKEAVKEITVFPGVSVEMSVALAARGSVLSWNVSFIGIPDTPPPPPTVKFLRLELLNWSVQEVGRGTLPPSA